LTGRIYCGKVFSEGKFPRPGGSRSTREVQQRKRKKNLDHPGCRRLGGPALFGGGNNIEYKRLMTLKRRKIAELDWELRYLRKTREGRWGVPWGDKSPCSLFNRRRIPSWESGGQINRLHEKEINFQDFWHPSQLKNPWKNNGSARETITRYTQRPQFRELPGEMYRPGGFSK